MKYQKLFFILVSISSLIAFMDQAHAGFKIRISDGIDSQTVGDNAFDDLDTSTFGEQIDGVLVVSHSFDWGDLNFTAGVSKPAIGGPSKPQIHLSALRISSFFPHANDITIEITDTDFIDAPGGINPATFNSSIGGVTSGTVSFATFVDSSNAEFGKGQALGAPYQYSSIGGGDPAFSTALSSTQTTGAPFSLTLQATVSHGGAGVTSFDAELKAVPEPATWLAWSGTMPMLGLMLWAKRRRESRRS